MIYKFGVFEFDDETRELRKNGRAAALEPQPAKALALLLSRAADRGGARAEEIVSREELRDAVWGKETHVDFERGIAYCISQIRSSLGDSGDNPRFVETVPKRGFRWIAPVLAEGRQSSGESEDGPRAPAATFNSWVTVPLILAMAAAAVGMVFELLTAKPVPERVVIAVSIFDNETGEPQFDRPVAGLSDLVVERLATLDPNRLAVIGNAAVLRQPRNIRNLKAVANNVRADYVVLGQLQRGETGLRFITHFIRLDDEAHLKANRLQVADDLSGLEAAVVAEFERATRELVLNGPAN